MRTQIMEPCSIYSWSQVRMNHESLRGHTSAHLQQCSSCQIQHFWHCIIYNPGCGGNYPACTTDPTNVDISTVTPVDCITGLSDRITPEWKKRLDPEMITGGRRIGHGSSEWPPTTGMSESPNDQRNPTYKTHYFPTSTHHVMLRVSKHYPASLTRGFN